MELKSTTEQAKQIVDALSTHLKDKTNDYKVSVIQQSLSWWLDDVFKIIKNINETSLNDDDRFKRIIELESKYSIPKTYLI